VGGIVGEQNREPNVVSAQTASLRRLSTLARTIKSGDGAVIVCRPGVQSGSYHTFLTLNLHLHEVPALH